LQKGLDRHLRKQRTDLPVGLHFPENDGRPGDGSHSNIRDGAAARDAIAKGKSTPEEDMMNEATRIVTMASAHLWNGREEFKS
jgi:hypothetical protein